MASNPLQPRLRVNKTATLNIDTTWRKIVFDGTSTFNANTFGKNASGKQMVEWDPTASTNGQFKFYDQIEQNYICFLSPVTTTTLITTRATLQYRCVIPNGGGAGINTYFPYPDQGGYVDASEVTLLTSAMLHQLQPFPLYLNQNIRTNGFWIEVKLSNSLITLGVCTLNSCSFLIQSTK